MFEGFSFEKKISAGHIMSFAGMVVLTIGAYYAIKGDIEKNAMDIKQIEEKVDSSEKAYLAKFTTIDQRFTKISDKDIERAREIAANRERLASIEALLQSNSKQLDHIASLIEDLNRESRTRNSYR